MARGGSTRIPLKNIAKLGSRTVLSYTLEDVRDLQCEFPGVSCVLMSDDSTIRESATNDEFRPNHFEIISQSDIEASDLQEWLGIQRVLFQKEAAGRAYQYVMLMGADNILRSHRLLGDAYRRIQHLANPNLMVQSAIPVPTRFHPCRVRTVDPDQEEAIPWPANTDAILSQDFPKCYAITGGVFIVRRNLIHGNFQHIGRHLHLLITDECLEIDTPEDLEYARNLIDRGI
jgi:CMP-N-acetylneuraminic acid synthetase